MTAAQDVTPRLAPRPVPHMAQIICEDERLCHLLENELAYLGIVARSFPAPPPPEELRLLIWNSDSLPQDEGLAYAKACKCPILLFAREAGDLPAPQEKVGCLRRPFSLTELEKTIRRLLETTPPPASSGAVTPAGAATAAIATTAPPTSSASGIMTQNGTVTVGGRNIPLTRAEWDIFSCLYRHLGSPVSRDELASLLEGGGNSVDVYICRLRAKIEKPLGRRMIRTVRGVGYQLDIPE